MIRNPFARTRRPRPTDPDPFTRLDHLDGLPGRTRYDAEWPDVLAAEAPGGDLAAMAAPLADLSTGTTGICVFMDDPRAPWPGMARDDLGTYAEPVTESTWTGPTYIPSVTGLTATFAGDAYSRIVADLRGLDRELDAFADGRAYESGSRCRTDSAALRRAGEHLTAPDGARRAALVLAGFTGAEAWAV